jgi:hypothetical protein
MEKIIEYFKESKITLVVFVIALLVAVLANVHIWDVRQYGLGIDLLMSFLVCIPFLGILTGIIIDIKNHD